MAFNKKRLILPERIEKKNPESQSDFFVCFFGFLWKGRCR